MVTGQIDVREAAAHLPDAPTSLEDVGLLAEAAAESDAADVDDAEAEGHCMSDDVSFQRREFKGSRLRCLLATSLADREVAAFLNQVVQPHARVSDKDTWQPRGLSRRRRSTARRGRHVSDCGSTRGPHRLAADGARADDTPKWDIVSPSATVESRCCRKRHLREVGT